MTPDHPVIRNCERTGWPDGKEPEVARCPVCGDECSTIYKDHLGHVVGCGGCVMEVPAWTVDECYEKGE